MIVPIYSPTSKVKEFSGCFTSFSTVDNFCLIFCIFVLATVMENISLLKRQLVRKSLGLLPYMNFILAMLTSSFSLNEMNLGQTEHIQPLKSFKSEWSPNPLPPSSKHKWSELTVTRALEKSSFCQDCLFLVFLGRDSTGFHSLIKTISAFKMYLGCYNIYVLFIISE